VAVLRPLGLGDFLTGLPAYRGLRRHFPKAELVLASPLELEPLAKLSGIFERVVPTLPLTPLGHEFASFDVAVNLHGRGSDSTRILLDARPGRVIAFHHPLVPETEQLARWKAGEHEVARWCRLLASAGIPCDSNDLDLPVPDLAVPPFARGATLVHVGAASAARRWPPERWSVVVRAERAAGREVVLTGALPERPIAEQIARTTNLPAQCVLAGRTSLVELAALVHASGRVVCGDTGVSHLATAYRRPSVTLFGPTSPSTWGPPDRPYHRVLWAGRLGDSHGTEPDPGLLAIEADHVLAALAALDDASVLTAGSVGR
jgi:ADP-heptose:LPS heptosyltransferase